MRKWLWAVAAILILIVSVDIWLLGRTEYEEVSVVNCSEGLDAESMGTSLIAGERIYIPEGEGYFVLDLNGLLEIHKVEIKCSGTCETAVINADYSGMNDYGTVKEDQWLWGKEAVEGSDLRINYDSKEGFWIEDIKIYGKNNTPDYLYEENQVLWEADDAANPLSVYRRPICGYVESLARDILKGKGTLTDHEKIVAFMDYISGYRVGYTRLEGEDYLYSVIVRKIGSCGDYSNLLAALCKTQGIESRLLTLSNYPEGTGHAVVECKINGEWSMYDPTYALYYTVTPEEKRNPKVVSFEDLRAGAGRMAVRVMGNENHILGDLSYEYCGPDIYECAEPAGIVSPVSKLYYPLQCSAQSGENVDLAGMQGAGWLGMGSTGNAWIWEISGLESGKKYKFVVESYGLADEAGYGRLETNARSSNAEIIAGDTRYWKGESGETWEITFAAQGDTAELVLDYQEKEEPVYLYIGISAVSICEADQ